MFTFGFQISLARNKNTRQFQYEIILKKFQENFYKIFPQRKLKIVGNRKRRYVLHNVIY